MRLSRAFLSAAACMAAPIEHRWLSIVLILTTMMYGARAGDFQFEGRETLDFFLTQCEVTASSWRRDRMPLNNPVQWRSIGPINVRDLELSEVFENATRPALRCGPSSCCRKSD